MSETVQVRRLAARYRLRPSEFGQRSRLDRLLRDVASDAMELALERAGIRSSEIVCIRTIHVPVRLRLSRPDSALAAEWARLLAEAIADAASDPNAAVRYASRSLALFEMGAHIAQGRFHDVWAWRQIGLWRKSVEAANRVTAAREFAGALVGEPEAAVAVLAALAKGGLLHRLAPDLESAWPEIAEAALRAARGTAGDWRAEWTREQARVPQRNRELGSAQGPGAYTDSPRHEEVQTGPATSRQAANRAARTLERSRILADLQAITLSEGAASAAALLALLECEPSLVRAGMEQLGAAVSALRASRLESQSDSCKLPPPEIVPPRRSAARRLEPGPKAPELAAPRSATRLPQWEPGELSRPEPVAPSSETTATERARRESGEVRDVAPRDLPSPVPDAPVDDAPVADEGARISPRIEGLTEFGGLLFLLRILDQLQIPDRVLALEQTVARGFAWFLHRIALTLQPVESGDPAALAFCGLAPDAESPLHGQPLPSPEEQEQIEAFATKIRNALSAVMPEPARPPEMLMQFVCRRSAVIVADPGWIEVRLPLRDVSTEIRRAGLDLDLNYVPWLGTVVRFVYE